jgi:hypothetical protein
MLYIGKRDSVLEIRNTSVDGRRSAGSGEEICGPKIYKRQM